MFGLNQHTTDFLNEKFRKGEVEKTYWAICVGKPQLASHSGKDFAMKLKLNLN